MSVPLEALVVLPAVVGLLFVEMSTVVLLFAVELEESWVPRAASHCALY